MKRKRMIRALSMFIAICVLLNTSSIFVYASGKIEMLESGYIKNEVEIMASSRKARTGTYTTNQVKTSLDSLLSQYPANAKWTRSFAGGTQCYAFAHFIFNSVFNRGNSQVGNGAISSNATCYKLNNIASDIRTIGTLAPGYSASSLESLLENAAPGDYIQVKRRSSGGAHSMIVMSVDASSNTIDIYDANAVASNTIGHYTQTFSYFMERNQGVSVYRYSGYDASLQIVAPPVPQTISDGDYHIVSGVDATKCLTVQDMSKVSGANIQLWESLDEAEQVFHVKYMGDGYYEIYNINSGMCLDVTDGKTTARTNLQQCTRNNADAQRWVIKESGDGLFYNIISKCGGMYVDVVDGRNQNGTNIWMYTGNGADAQKWKFIPWSTETNHKISDGDYHIVSGVDDTKCLTVQDMSKVSGANIQLWESLDEAEQVFHVKYMGDGYYEIYNVNSGKCLDVTDGRTTARTNLQQCTRNNADAQRWIIRESGDGYSYNIISKCGGMYVDVVDGRNQDGTNIWMYTGNGANAQKWKFVPWSTESNHKITDGDYYIVSEVDETKCMTVKDKSKVSGANIQLWSSLDEAEQAFRVRYMGDGYYEIYNINSGKCLDVTDGKTTARTNLQQCTRNNADAQRWIIKESGDGSSYNIISKCGGMYIDVVDGLNQNGTNIWMLTGNGANAQKWFFRKIITADMVNIAGTQFTYNGEEQKPEVIVEADGKTLIENTDYTVSCFNNINAGTATITIVGKGNYIGTVTKNFIINKANQEITASVSSSTIREGATVQIKVKGQGEKTYSSNNPSVAIVNASGVVTGKSAGVAMITVTAEEISNYFASSTTVPVTVTHDYGNGVVTTEVTCTEDGIRTYTCNGCGKAYTEVIQATGHRYEEAVKEATCTEQGYTTYTCLACGNSYQNFYVDALGHAFDDGVITKIATDETDGVKTYTCTRCYAARKEAIPATGHTYDNGTVTKEATCTEEGIMTYRCTDCGRTYIEKIVSQGHHYIVSVVDSTCTRKGYTVYTCMDCGDSYRDTYTDATGHHYNDGEIAEEPTCTEEGLKIYTCTVCRNQYTETIAEAGHRYEERKTAPTCTKQGYTTHSCVVCLYSYNDNYVNAIGHIYDEGEIIEEPTCTEEGIQIYSCKNCHDQYTKIIAASGHQYEGTVTDPTCTERGYIIYTCSKCRDEHVDNYIPAKGHRWNDGEITVAATAISTGIRTYTCVDCGERKTEMIPILSGGRENKPSNPGISTSLTANEKDYRLAVGEIVSVGGNCYQMGSSGMTVEYIKAENSSVISVKIPKFIYIKGVAYAVTSVSNAAFKNHLKLQSVTIPEGIKVIGDAAFENCRSLKKIVIPTSVVRIGKRAFYRCRKLKSLTIRTKKLTKKNVGTKAFSKAGCANYKNLRVIIPKGKKKAYRVLLKKKGLSSKVKIK